MITTLSHPDRWTLALENQSIAPDDFAEGIERETARLLLDFRTRLLIRDGLDALQSTWGQERMGQWPAHSSHRSTLESIRNESLGPPAFPSLTDRLIDPTRTDTVVQFLRELSQNLQSSTSIAIGGSVALIISGALRRKTDDIDLVDEVSVQIRSQHDLLESLARRYALRLIHFQSHDLPPGWEMRTHLFDTFGPLEIGVVDSGDIFLSKLISSREKDRDDVRELSRNLDKQALTHRLLSSAAALVKEDKLRQNAEKNWYILYGQSFPVGN